MQKYVEDPLAEEILRGTFKDGSVIVAKHFENLEELTFLEGDSAVDSGQEEKEKSDTSEAQ